MARRWGHSLLALLLLGLTWGCGFVASPSGVGRGGAPPAQQAPLVRLEADLARLLGRDDPEAHLLARTVLERTAQLANHYGVRKPALWHNVLVNAGMRERGLCCHWTQDLMHAVEALRLRHYRAVWGVSRHGTWREHNSIVVTASGKPFAEGLVLDPWRSAGELYWIRVAEDGYAWQPHPGNRDTLRIRCR